MGKPDWRQLVRQFPHIGGTLQLQYYSVLLLAARGQLHYETNDFIYLAIQSVSQMIPTFDAISHFLGREVKHFDFLCCLHASKPTLFSNVRDPHSPLPQYTTYRAFAGGSTGCLGRLSGGGTANLRMCKQMTCQKNVGK